MDAVKSCFSQYVGFKGRARRSEYWYFCLFEIVVDVVLSVLMSVTGAQIFGILSGIFGLACLLPGLAVAIRRMHDIGTDVMAFIKKVKDRYTNGGESEDQE